MNKCPNCGKTISEYATICPHCKMELNYNSLKEKDIKSLAIQYSGNVVKETMSYVIPSIISFVIMIIQEAVNKSVLGNIGTNAEDAYILCQNNMGVFKRFIFLLVVFVICGIATNFLMKKIGDRTEIRIAVGVAGVVIYTSILVLICVNPNVGGREDLIVYVRTLTRTMGMFYGLVYGFITMSEGYHLSQKNYVVAAIEVVVNACIIIVSPIVLLSIMQLGTASIYNMIIAVAVIVISIAPILFTKKKK